MNEFTIKIDLSNFFDDERRMAVLLVNQETVGELQRRVESLFELRDIHFTTTESCYVPPQESIRVISNVDTLKAFVFSNNKQDTASNSKKVKKRKFEQALSSSTPKPEAKRSKGTQKSQSPKSKETTINIVEDFSDINKCDATTINKSKTQKNSKSLHNITVEKSKRCVASCGKLTQIVSLNGNNTHILFDNNDEEDKSVEQNEKAESNDTETNGNISLASDPISKIIFRCALESLVTKSARTFQLKPKKSNVEILEHITLKAKPVEKSFSNQLPEITQEIDIDKNHTSSILNHSKKETLDDSSVILLEESNEFGTSKNVLVNVTNIEKTPQKSLVSKTVSEDYSTNALDKLKETALPLENLPKPGDTIIFKVSVPSKKKKNTAATTDFIVAICDYVNRRSKSVTLSLLHFSSDAEPYLRIYGANLDDSNNCNLEKIILNVSKLIDPHIVKN